MSTIDFFSWSTPQKHVVYKSLVECLKRGEPFGIANNDRGHPAYAIGARDGYQNYDELGDSEEHNAIYSFLRPLADQMRDSGEYPEEDIVDSWQKFCRLVVNAKPL